MGAVMTSKAKTNELKQIRRDAHKKMSREKIASELKAIEARAERDALHDPIYPDRTYGLPIEMEDSRVDIWGQIVQHVEDLDTLKALWEVCPLFKDLLRRKYVQANLPEIIVQCLELKFIPYERDRSSDINWARILCSHRTVSSLTKSSLDRHLDRGMLGDVYGSDLWFSTELPHYNLLHWKIPILMLGASNAQRSRLQKALQFLEVEGIEKCPVTTRAIIFNEFILNGGAAVDLLEIRNEFQELLEKIGERIISFGYMAQDNHANVYSQLRRFVELMPNLEELIVNFRGDRSVIANFQIIMNTCGGETTVTINAQPFPHCKNLKRYAEGWDGFNSIYLKEIFKANRTIEGVQLCQTPAMGPEVHGITSSLDLLQLKSFHSTSFPLVDFINHPFQWVGTLTTLALWDTRTGAAFTPDVCTSSRTLFGFISKCENLKSLFVSSSLIRDTGGSLQNLPKLESVFWKLVSKFQSLEFLNPVEGLSKLALDVSACPQLHGRDRFMQFLEKKNVPDLFPALRQIQFRTEGNDMFEIVWRNGSVV